jgi:hypothetical protein
MSGLPVVRTDVDRVARIRDAVVGTRLENVQYRQTRHSGLAAVPEGNLHEVDLDVVLRLSTGTVDLTWERDNLIEGLAIDFPFVHAKAADNEILVPANASDQWRRRIGDRIGNVHFGWQVSEENCPESLWSLRLSFETGASVVFALGELDSGGAPTYHPDAIVVLFDERTARSYRQPGAIGSAWAVD